MFPFPDEKPPARPTLTVVPDDQVAVDPPEEQKVLPDLPTDDEQDYGSPAYPNFLPPNIGLDTQFTNQPHWLTDAKGEPFTFRLNPSLANLVTILVESSATPYKSKSEFFRDAAYYLARTIRDLFNMKDSRLESLLQEADLRSKSDYEAKLQEEVLEFEHSLTDAVIGNLERGALGEACRNIAFFWGSASAFAVPYRRRAYQDAMKKSPLIQAILQLGHAHGALLDNTAYPPFTPFTSPADQAV